MASIPPSVVKEPYQLGLDDWHLTPRVGDIEHKVQRPTQQLGQRPYRPGKAICLETPHPQGVSLSHYFLIIAVRAFTGAARLIEVLPSLGAALDRPNETRMVSKMHALRVAQDTETVGTALLLVGGH